MRNFSLLLGTAFGILSLNSYAVNPENATISLNLDNNTQKTLVLDPSSFGQDIIVTPSDITLAPGELETVNLRPIYIEPYNPYIHEALNFDVKNSAQKTTTTISENIFDPPCRSAEYFSTKTNSNGDYNGSLLGTYRNNCNNNSAKLQVSEAAIQFK